LRRAGRVPVYLHDPSVHGWKDHRQTRREIIVIGGPAIGSSGSMNAARTRSLKASHESSRLIKRASEANPTDSISAGCALVLTALIGHNPGLHDLAVVLAKKSSPDFRALASGKFPTATYASFKIPTR
jgi:hypothetical protein